MVVNHLIGHIEPSIIFGALGLWWLTNAAYLHYSSPYTKKPFRSYGTYRFRFLCGRARKWPIEGYIRIVIFFVTSAYDTTDAFTNNTGFSKFLINPHTLMFLAMAVSGLIEILLYHNITIPDGIEFVALSWGFAVEALLLKQHLVGRRALDVEIHTMLCYQALSTAVVVFMEAKYRHSYILSFVRGYLMVFQATWLGHVGALSDYEDSHFLSWTHTEYKWEKMKSLAYFVWHAVIDLFFCLTMAALVCLFVVRKYRHAHRDQKLNQDNQDGTAALEEMTIIK